MKKIFKASLLMAVISLVACGGGSGNDSSSNNTGGDSGSNSGGSSSNYVSGSFKESSDTGVYYGESVGISKHYREYGALGDSCRDNNNDYYFESDRVLVFGSRGLADSDFQKLATWVDGQIDSVASSMGGMTFDDIVNVRGQFTQEVVFSTLSYIQAIQVDSVPYPADYAEWESNEQHVWVASYYRGLTENQKYDLLASNSLERGYDFERQDISYEKKIYVCMHEDTNSNYYGEGNKIGISVAAPSVNTPSGYIDIIKHELVHTVQLSLYDTTFQLGLPRWFAEGQAVVLAGQDVASQNNHGDYHVPYFVSFSDESGIDPGDIYKHYGLAYKYLQDANGVDKMVKVISGMDDTIYNSFVGDDAKSIEEVDYNFNDGYTSHPRMFIKSFDDAELVDNSGSDLSLKRFKADYDIIL